MSCGQSRRGAHEADTHSLLMQLKIQHNIDEADVIFARDNADRNNLLKTCVDLELTVG